MYTTKITLQKPVYDRRVRRTRPSAAQLTGTESESQLLVPVISVSLL